MESIQDSFSNVDWAGLAGMVGKVLAILVVTWIVAKAVKWIFGKLASKIPALQGAGADGENLGQSIGSIGSLLVWLFGLTALLDVLGMRQVLAPIQSLLNQVFEFLPDLIAAGLLFFVGFMIAKIAGQLLETALGTLPFDKWFGQGDETGEESGGGSGIPKMASSVVSALILIVVAIAALDVLGIAAISGPATEMLNTIFDTIPAIIAAAVMLAIGVMIARFATDLLQQILDGFNTDRALRDMEVLPEGKSATPGITKVVQVIIVLFFAVMAAQLLGFPQITTFLTQVLDLAGSVVFGGAIIAVGFFVANLLSRMASGTGGTVIKYATLVLFAAMGLKYMGLADSIINLAFGALVVGGAAAAALAFGLGGRDAAARQLDRLSQGSGSGSSASGGPSQGI